ncbi:MAG: SRPBCC family protein [Pyrinomonadaceae bacterium]
MIHRLHQEQFIYADIETIWDYFSTPHNLNEITPPDLGFEIVNVAPGKMFQGQLIEYRVSFVKGIWTRWLTEIRHVREGEYFVDEQRIGPYKLWYHEHTFSPEPGGVRMLDTVTYAIGYEPLGTILNALWIKRKLNWIFDYRKKGIEQLFNHHTTK